MSSCASLRVVVGAILEDGGDWFDPEPFWVGPSGYHPGTIGLRYCLEKLFFKADGKGCLLVLVFKLVKSC